MRHIQLASGYASYNVKDCQTARDSLRYYKKKAHKKMRQLMKKEIHEIE